jgi:hypothetical protein
VGQSETTHRKGLWIDEPIIRVFFDEPMAFATRFEIEPFGTGEATTRFRAANRILGNLEGRFIIEGDSIRSQFRSEDGHYSAWEQARMVGEGIYRSGRVLLNGDRALSSWRLEFRWMIVSRKARGEPDGGDECPSQHPCRR